ncbi:hypothetical protein DICPUDRAFT_32306 [Dictyostelium purpureum]|uniref:HpcH/HpaI aldolase/citrate lyase domain-containing protein n=1 Tax=Dictyostelium purpureum TaxID=5786 RepID=F0ZIT0_DICPU|nr:uncharacterized protein DICPUDRAFT_32306 [Dictyostelium purpureum]EGC36142.1 hypothetical protein DICPUDRAFT_32306 [Dictyostelium purpureum]|eukprot:XP_003287335.1 hypothetical protein DICPUDRAFT_32306 [Dictyostelium purpureum]
MNSQIFKIINKNNLIKTINNFNKCYYSTSIKKPSSFNKSQNIFDKPLRRVFFNVPGSDRRKIDKAIALSDKIDSIVLDIEDGVAINKKEEAREMIKKSVVEDSFGKAELLVRVNSVDSGLLEADIDMIAKIPTYIDGIVIPKVEHPYHLHYITLLLREKCGDKNAANLKFMACVESAISVINLKDICNYSLGTDTPSQLNALIFASEDYCADTGITRTPSATELLYARSSVVNHAVAHGLQAIDMVCINYKDQEALKKETLEGVHLGFHGKQAIHPNQIEIINDCFRPSLEKFRFASKIVEENEIHQSQGKGAFEIDGKMIDMPMVKWAKKVLSIETFYPPREEEEDQ